MISVIIPLYNKEPYIERTIRSVLSQTFGEFEIVVVDDGSTDNSAAVVEGMHQPLVRLIRQENGGVSAARNRGIEEARFDYVAFLDADDEWKENHLEVIVNLIKEYPECGVFGTSYYFAKEGGNATLPILPNRFPFQGEQGVLTNYYEMASGTDFPIHMSSYAVRKTDIQKIGGFPVGIPSGEDIITLARLHAVCDLAYSKLPTSVYYLVSEGKNARPVQMKNPLDKAFDALLKSAAHRKGVRRFVSSWHKRRMVGAIYARNYVLMLREFFLALTLYPLQKKLYTSLLASTFSVCTGKDLYSINQALSKKKRKNMLVLIPVGGLANRMKAIDSAVALAKDARKELRIIWFKDWGLNCRFDELFQPLALPNVKVQEASLSDLLVYDRPRKKNFRLPRLFQRLLFDACIYEDEATQLFYKSFDFRSWAEGRRTYIASCVYFYPQSERKLFSIFHPIAPLQQKIDESCSRFGEHTLGVHIRRTDNIASISQSPTELFFERMEEETRQHEDTVFYLATDSEEDKKRLKEQFGERIVTSSRKADRGNVEGMQDALVELYILSRTGHILGSMQSSYSETAAQISGITCELLKKQL